MERLYAATADRLLVVGPNGDVDERRVGRQSGVDDGSDRRHGADDPAGPRLECVAVPPGDPDRAFVGTFGDGLYRSVDGGDAFQRLDTPFVDKAGDDDEHEGQAVTALTVRGHDPAVVYAGTEPSRLYRSADGGETWTELEGIVDCPSEPEWYFPPRPHTHHVRWIEVDPSDPDRLVVGIEAGALLYTADGGRTWTERPPGSPRDNHSFASHDREGRLYAAAGDGYAESDDGGASWRRPEEGLAHTYCWSVVADPADPDRVLVSSASGARTAHRTGSADAHLYRREGGPWERLDGNGLPTGEDVTRAVLATTDEPGTAYAATNRGLFVSRDFGGRWEPLVERSIGTARGLAVVG